MELMITLFLLNICLLLFTSQYAHVGNLSVIIVESHKKLMIMQQAMEHARISKKNFSENYVLDGYTIQVEKTEDAILKKFSHIIVTLYDKNNKKNIWYSGVVTSDEA